MQELADQRESPVLCIYQYEAKSEDDEDEEIDWVCVGAVQRLLSEQGSMDSLSVLLHSPGGDIDCAYRIIRAIRENAKHVEVLVPVWAKSAATLICVGADQILLGSTGEMGPLDVQLYNPGGGRQTRSGLETFQGLAQVQRYALETLGKLIEYFIEQERLNAPHCYERAEALFAAIVSPLYQQINPNELGELGRHQASSEEYLLRVMDRWSYADQEENDEEERKTEDIAWSLVWDYPSHGFVIDIHEAKELKLRAERMDREAERLCLELLEATPSFVGIGMPSQ